ncbi:nuclease [Lysinibacillus sp. PLM2]|nr:nuclease [Lysinibacillus sp. PLM2]
MIVLGRAKSSKLQVLEAISRRLALNDFEYPKFQEMYFRQRKGYQGELKVDTKWNELRIPIEHYLLYNYETVNEVGNTHQIDTIMLSPNFIFIVEIKNISGKIDYDEEKRQFTNTKEDDRKEVYSNPVDQVERHTRLITRMMDLVGIQLPVESAIVFSNTSTTIGLMPKRIPSFHLSGLYSHMTMLFKKHSKQAVSIKEMNVLKDFLLESLKRERWKPNIDKQKLLNGAICEQCNQQTIMTYSNGRFICPKCNTKSKEILLKSLNDYRLLFSPWISNRAFKQFFNIASSKTSYKLLKSLNLQSYGNNRGRLYFIPEDILCYKLE